MILTIGALVRAFASLLLSAGWSKMKKRLAVIGTSLALYIAYTYTFTDVVTGEVLFTSAVNGLVAGLTALGIYHASDSEN